MAQAATSWKPNTKTTTPKNRPPNAAVPTLPYWKYCRTKPSGLNHAKRRSLPAGQRYSAGLAGLHILVLPPALNALVAGHSGNRHHAGGLRQRKRNGGGVSQPAATTTAAAGQIFCLPAAEPTAAATAAAVPATLYCGQHLRRRRSAR